mgnify:CR=1 FL=1
MKFTSSKNLALSILISSIISTSVSLMSLAFSGFTANMASTDFRSMWGSFMTPQKECKVSPLTLSNIKCIVTGVSDVHHIHRDHLAPQKSPQTNYCPNYAHHLWAWYLSSLSCQITPGRGALMPKIYWNYSNPIILSKISTDKVQKSAKVQN